MDRSSKKLGDDDEVRRAAANYINKKSHQFSVGDEVRTITSVGKVVEGSMGVVVELLDEGDTLVILTRENSFGKLVQKELLRWQVEKNGSK